MLPGAFLLEARCAFGCFGMLFFGDPSPDVYLFGTFWVLPYRFLYVLGFFVATIADTSLIWLISAVTVALMTLPNLIGMLLMHKEVKQIRILR